MTHHLKTHWLNTTTTYSSFSIQSSLNLVILVWAHSCECSLLAAGLGLAGIRWLHAHGWCLTAGCQLGLCLHWLLIIQKSSLSFLLQHLREKGRTMRPLVAQALELVQHHFCHILFAKESLKGWGSKFCSLIKGWEMLWPCFP